MNNSKLLPNLLAFAEVAKLQSFTQAAQSLGVTKSTLSQQVKRLEQHIGQQLLTRHTRNMSLTPIGKKLYAQSIALQGQVDLALQEIDANKETPSGPFVFTAPHSCMPDIIAPTIQQLCTEFPQLKPDIIITDQPLDLIEHKLDAAIYAGDLPDSNYRALPLATVSEYLCASPGYLARAGRPMTLQDLPAHHFIATPWQDNSLHITTKSTAPHPSPVQFHTRCNTMPTTLELVRSGMGIALLPSFAVQDDINKGILEHILPTHQGRPWPFYLLHRFERNKPTHITRFHQLARYYFSKTI